jgi:hypothetical protein
VQRVVGATKEASISSAIVSGDGRRLGASSFFVGGPGANPVLRLTQMKLAVLQEFKKMSLQAPKATLRAILNDSSYLYDGFSDLKTTIFYWKRSGAINSNKFVRCALLQCYLGAIPLEIFSRRSLNICCEFPKDTFHAKWRGIWSHDDNTLFRPSAYSGGPHLHQCSSLIYTSRGN